VTESSNLLGIDESTVTETSNLLGVDESTVTETSNLLGVDNHMWNEFMDSPAPDIAPPPVTTGFTFMSAPVVTKFNRSRRVQDDSVQSSINRLVANMDVNDVISHPPEYFMFNRRSSVKWDGSYQRIQREWDTVISQVVQRNDASIDIQALHNSRYRALEDERKRLDQEGQEAQKMRIARSMAVVVQQIQKAQAVLAQGPNASLRSNALARRLLKNEYKEHWDNPQRCLFLLVQYGSIRLPKDA
jgi:hypothetical protein